jgi:hypothetical protein
MARPGGVETVNVETPAPGGASLGMMRGRDRAATVRRLRRDGWSYRRISAAVGLSYGEVSRLLDDDIPPMAEPVALAFPPIRTAPPPPADLPALAVPPPPVPVLRIPEPAPNGVVAANTRVLIHKVDGLARVAEDHRRALEQLSRDVAEVRTEQRALSRRVQELFTALWQRLLEVGRRSAPKDEASP